MDRRKTNLMCGIAAAIAALGFNASALAQPQRQPAPVPMMKEELMGRLIAYTRTARFITTADDGICKFLVICDGTAAMPMRDAVSNDTTNGIHHFLLPVDPDSKDILFMLERSGGNGKISETYLSDKTGKLRAASFSELGIDRLITNEKAQQSISLS